MIENVIVVDDGEWRVDEPWPRCWSGELHAWASDFWGSSECAYCHVRKPVRKSDQQGASE